MASQEHRWIVARSLVLQKASYELQIPKSAASILFFGLRCWMINDFFLCQMKRYCRCTLKKKKKKNCSNGNLNFLSFSTEKHNVYNIYVAINVPSFFKLNCMCIYFSHWAKHICFCFCFLLHIHIFSSPLSFIYEKGTGRMK